MERQFGILMPIFSVDNIFGIGDFGPSSYKFVDYLAKSGAKIWQVLPLVQTGLGNSPYSSVCSDSFSIYYVSPEDLYERKLIKKAELLSIKCDCDRVDYDNLYNTRHQLLKTAFNRFDKSDKDFIKFKSRKHAYDYALFMALKGANNDKPFFEWENKYKFRDKKALISFAKENKEEIDFWQFVQFLANEQWQNLKAYANSKGVKIMGDMPLYVALDSVDVWTNPEVFKLDEDLMPKKKAGVPPDYFCAEGQLWGNPVYDYESLRKSNYSWWVKRLQKITSLFDYVRIDHFRGLDRYYEVDCDAENAMVGEWIDVPSKELFNEIFKKVDKNKIIAEDLGIIDDGVRELLSYTGCPGMKILSFAFNGDANNLYLPENIKENYICYTGTHDNDTLLGLIENFSDWDKNNIYNGVKSSLNNLNIRTIVKNTQNLINAIIELGFKCRANVFILPVQDALLLNSEYRINTPGLVDNKNWSTRIPNRLLSLRVANKLKNLCNKYNR